MRPGQLAFGGEIESLFGWSENKVFGREFLEAEIEVFDSFRGEVKLKDYF